MCQRCRHATAGWLDTYRDQAVCDRCANRDSDYGQAFVTVLTRADTQRLTDNHPHGGDR